LAKSPQHHLVVQRAVARLDADEREHAVQDLNTALKLDPRQIYLHQRLDASGFH